MSEDEAQPLHIRFSRSSRYYNLGLYPHAFEEAGRILSRAALGTDQDHVLFAPAIYVYRQAFELRLKRVISKARVLSDTVTQNVFHHRLHDLWEAAKTLMADIEYVDTSGFRAIEDVVAVFAAEDPNGTAFRFATGDGNIAVYADEFRKLIDAIEEGCNQLYGIAEGLDVWVAARDEEDGDYEAGDYENGD